MRLLGLREWVGLAALLVGVVIAATFLDPSSGGSSRPSSSSGTVAGRVPPTPTPMPTPGPPVPLAQPEEWVVGFHDITADGASRLDSQSIVNTLAFDIEGAPFINLRDDSWKLTAEAGFTADFGQYTIALEHRCELRVQVNQRTLGEEAQVRGGDVVTFSFLHPGGIGMLKVECRDAEGLFRLLWVGS